MMYLEIRSFWRFDGGIYIQYRKVNEEIQSLSSHHRERKNNLHAKPSHTDKIMAAEEDFMIEIVVSCQTIQELIQRIRDHINRREKQVQLIDTLSKWNRLTSALDVLSDSTSAIVYYANADFPYELGAKYLHIYGLLQCIMLQQDAAESISVTLSGAKVNWGRTYPEAFKAREIRHDVAGHPTNRNGTEFIFLVQHSLHKWYIEYYLTQADEAISPQIHSVDIAKAVLDTTDCVNKLLSEILLQLDAELKAHHNKFKTTQMANIFRTLGYAREKVMLHDTVFMDTSYQSTKGMVKACKDELVARYGAISVYESYDYLIKEIEVFFYLIDDGLAALHDETRQPVLDSLRELLFIKLEKLQSLCEETDEEFSVDT
jgi:hypothetical protein